MKRGYAAKISKRLKFLSRQQPTKLQSILEFLPQCLSLLHRTFALIRILSVLFEFIPRYQQRKIKIQQILKNTQFRTSIHQYGLKINKQLSYTKNACLLH